MRAGTPITVVSVPLGIALGLLLLAGLAQGRRGFVAAELGLGLQTHSFVARDASDQAISGNASAAPDLAARIASLRRRGHHTTLWLGASQLHAINRPGADARLAVAHAEARARTRRGRVAYTQLSLPNAGPLELLAVYQAFRRPPARPHHLVLAFTYDDLNETALRPDVMTLLDATLPDATEAPSPVLTRALKLAREQSAPAAPVARSATADTTQERLERTLVGWLESVWPAYAARHELRAAGIAAWKLPLTGLVFRLRGRPVQRVEPDAAARSDAALEELVVQTRADGVALLVYEAPHRPDEPRFYHDRAAYDARHAQLGARSREAGFAYLDLERLVPAETYGLTDQLLPDVFHFREEGHRLLGHAIDGWFESRGH